LVVLNDVEQLALPQLSDQDELSTGFKGIEEEDDILMLQLLQDFYLVAHNLDVLLLLALLLDGLDGHELPREFATGLVDVAVRALADEGDDVVVLLLVLAHVIQIILLHPGIKPYLVPLK
jgi:hypothetical protein